MSIRNIALTTKIGRFLFSAFPKFGRVPSGGGNSERLASCCGDNCAGSKDILFYCLLSLCMYDTDRDPNRSDWDVLTDKELRRRCTKGCTCLTSGHFAGVGSSRRGKHDWRGV